MSWRRPLRWSAVSLVKRTFRQAPSPGAIPLGGLVVGGPANCSHTATCMVHSSCSSRIFTVKTPDFLPRNRTEKKKKTHLKASYTLTASLLLSETMYQWQQRDIHGLLGALRYRFKRVEFNLDSRSAFLIELAKLHGFQFLHFLIYETDNVTCSSQYPRELEDKQRGTNALLVMDTYAVPMKKHKELGVLVQLQNICLAWVWFTS